MSAPEPDKADENYQPQEIDWSEEMRSKAAFSNRIELLWLRVLRIEAELKRP